MAIAVVDDGGHLPGMLRLDDCIPVGSEMTIGKARTSALARRESSLYEDMINNGRTALGARLVDERPGGVADLAANQAT